jgi:hypothetical protein
MQAFRRGIAWLVLVGFLSAQGAVWVAARHAVLEDDAACAALDGPKVIGIHHGTSASKFADANTPNPIEHCAYCHLQRAVSSARLARVVAATIASERVAAPREPVLALILIVLPGLPSRGPPVSIA